MNDGDHAFVKHPSVINYTDARLIDLKAVETAIEKQPKNLSVIPSALLLRLVEKDSGRHEENKISQKTHKAAVSC